jgi:hypothetical protein
MFEIGDCVVHVNSEKPGTIENTKGDRIPMVMVIWTESEKKEWIPADMVRKSGHTEFSEANRVFNQSDGEVTKTYYAKMNARGLQGQLAVSLFRAQKRSIAAKKYKRGRFVRDAYDVKNWSISEICRILATMQDFEMAPRWGWKRDPSTPGYEWVLYVDLPTGQCSFHTASRLNGPDFDGEWDGIGMSKERICRYCDMVAGIA